MDVLESGRGWWAKWLLLLLILLSVTLESQGRDLLIAGPPWPPFLNPDHPRKGVATEIVVSCLERAGYPAKVVIKPWPRVLAEAQRGDIDALIGLWYNPQRAERFYYTNPYYVNEIYLFRLRDRPIHYSGLEDLVGIRIGVRQNAWYGREFDKADFLEKVELNELLSILRMVSIGRLDAGVGDRLIVERLIESEPELNERLMLSEPAVSLLPLHMGVSRRHPDHREIVAKFNQALKALLDDGTLKAIYGSWNIGQSPELAFQFGSEE